VERLEIEGPPQDAALLRRIADETGLDWLGSLAPGQDPAAALTAGGLVVIQERRTLRRRRNIVAASGAGPASLAIDSVDYEAGGSHLRHHEIEIEALTLEGARLLDTIAAMLCEAFPGELKPWRPSKLRTGIVLQSLVHRVGAAPLVGPGGDLLPESYSRLLQELRRSA
jgi:hypothetical protein